VTCRRRAFNTLSNAHDIKFDYIIIHLRAALLSFCCVASAADDIFVSAALARLFDAPAGDELGYSRARCTQLAGLEVRRDDTSRH